MGFTSDEMRQFVEAVRGEPEGGECVVRGTVTRVDADGTAWVQIGQNAEPTPCERDMACHVGDSVTVRIADHRATVTGNATSPATDDHEAKVAHGVAMAAQTSAKVAHDEAEGAQQAAASASTTARNAAQTADAAHDAAAEAKTIAEATGQHVWDDESGLHVTEVEREDYEQTPTGFARLMTSAGELLTRAVEGVEKLLRSDTASGMVVYDGECAPDAQDLEDHVVGAFTKDGAQIGRKGNAHVEMDFNSFKMVDKGGVDFFVADDLRDETGVATLTQVSKGDGSTKNFFIPFIPDEFVSVTDSSHEGAAYSTSYNYVTFDVAPDDGATVTIVYKTHSSDAKTYTLGKRMPGSAAGPMSVATGVTTTASGAYSHAEGHGTTARGMASHAEGWDTIASSGYSHAEGYGTTSGSTAHAEGHNTTANGSYSHAEGDRTAARSGASHAEGTETQAIGHSAHVEGRSTTTVNDYAHAEGLGTFASASAQHVEGRYNKKDLDGTYAHIIGNGTDDDHRSNAYTVDWDGNVTAAGDVSDGVGTLDAVRKAAQPSTIVDLIYPVGSIYMSVNSTSPATLFGGTWQRITGQFLLGATDNGGTGGNSTASVRAGYTGGEATHKLTSGESGLPAHHHKMQHEHTGPRYAIYDYDYGYSGGYYTKFPQGGPKGWASSNTQPATSLYTGNTSDNTAASASSSHNNMPPYLAVYIWKRTA